MVENGGQLDIMAQQLKFVACLKILMEELSTLATGFEVDGGQLRYHLYIWLEALRQLCNYSFGDIDTVSAGELTCLIVLKSLMRRLCISCRMFSYVRDIWYHGVMHVTLCLSCCVCHYCISWPIRRTSP